MCQGDSGYWQPENWNITRGEAEGNIPVQGLPMSTITLTHMCYLFYYTEKSIMTYLMNQSVEFSQISKENHNLRQCSSKINEKR